MIEFKSSSDQSDSNNTSNQEEGIDLKEKEDSARVAILIISSTKTKENDDSGKKIIQQLEKAGHRVVEYIIVPAQTDKVKAAFKTLIHKVHIDGIITSGGTGIAKDDVTIDIIEPMFESRLPTFSQVLAKISFVEIGTKCILSRPCAGIINKKIIFCLPGNPHTCLLASKQLIIPELNHIVHHLKGG